MANTIQNWEQMTYPFFNITLNYNLNAFEPHIDTRTMHVHYNTILADYIKKLNQHLESHSELQSMTLIELISHAETSHDTELLRKAGEVYSHFFFFTELRPSTGQIIIGITPQATHKITSAFGGWKNFKDEFTNAALSIFGSGCVWLIKDNKGELRITTKPIIPQNCTPILCLDTWEHAYFLKHLNNRQAYVDAFWNVVDWVKFSEKI